MTSLCRDANLFDFFHEHVDEAVAATGHDVSEEGVFYLSNLLVQRSHDDTAEAANSLVELHLEAAQTQDAGDRGRAVSTWRRLGDQALYVSGFYPTSLGRKAVGVDYYMAMGRAAYDRLARMLGPVRGSDSGRPGATGHRGFDAIFAELAATFEQCSDVLSEVRGGLDQQRSAVSDRELLRLIEEYQATGSPRTLRRLRKLGFMLESPADTPC